MGAAVVTEGRREEEEAEEEEGTATASLASCPLALLELSLVDRGMLLPKAGRGLGWALAGVPPTAAAAAAATVEAWAEEKEAVEDLRLPELAAVKEPITPEDTGTRRVVAAAVGWVPPALDPMLLPLALPPPPPEVAARDICWRSLTTLLTLEILEVLDAVREALPPPPEPARETDPPGPPFKAVRALGTTAEAGPPPPPRAPAPAEACCAASICLC